MILLVVGLVAVLVVVLIAVVLSIRLGRGDEEDEPDIRPRGRDRRGADEDERWRERDARRAPPAPVRGMDSRSRRGEYPGYAERGAARDRDRAARDRDYDGPPRRPARADATGYRRPAAARPPVPASAQARGRYDTGPQRRSADGLPSADYPSRDFGPSGARPSGDHSSAEFPAADYDTSDYPEDRPRPRRKAASANGKSRSRQRGKRGDDDDWPSTEWDKLSDEQYWAELSADKPLAAMAKPSGPAGKSGAKAPVNGSAKRAAEPPAAREPRPARTPPPAPPARDLPSRKERTEPREPVTERLPVRARQQPPAPAARQEAGPPLAGSYASEPRSPGDTGPHAQRDPLRDSGPWARRDTGPQAIRDSGARVSRDTGPRPEQPRRSTATGPGPARDRDLAMLAGLAGASPPIPGALDDDPLTSPSFSLKADTAADSRSYSSSRKHAKTDGQDAAPGHAAGNGAAHANGNGNGSYPTADYANAGYAYQAASAAAPVEQWHSAPPAPAGAHAPAYGNPYQHSGPGATGSPAGAQAAPGHAGYLADPLRVYSPPAYEAPQYPEPARPAYHALPDRGMTAPPPPAGGPVPYADGYAKHAYPDPAAYHDGHATGGYGGGYEAGHAAGDPHAAGGYGPYPPQG
jgi:hypothetical protein